MGGVSLRPDSGEAAGAAGGFGRGGGFSGCGSEPVRDRADAAGGRRNFHGSDAGAGAAGANKFEFDASRKGFARQSANPFLLASNSNLFAPAAPAPASLPWKFRRPPAASARSRTGSLPQPEKPPPRPNPPAAPAASPESGRRDTPPTLYFRRGPYSVPCETSPAPNNSPSRRACPNRLPNSSSTAESLRGSPHKDPAPHTRPRWSPNLY